MQKRRPRNYLAISSVLNTLFEFGNVIECAKLFQWKVYRSVKLYNFRYKLFYRLRLAAVNPTEWIVRVEPAFVAMESP